MIWKRLLNINKEKENIYIPKLAKIKKITIETDTVKTFQLKPLKSFKFDFIPGQFMELSAFGIGEVPLSFSSSPLDKNMEVTVKLMGDVTHALFNLKPGECIGIRGPYGNGFSIKEIKSKNILIIGGGVALAPLRSLIRYIIQRRDDFGNVTIMYGSKTPNDIPFKSEVSSWKNIKGFNVFITVDKGDNYWNGDTGLVTTLFDKYNVPVDNTHVIVCGPEIMMKFTVQKLIEKGFEDSNIFLSMERRMKCGVGKCGHCNIGSKFVCQDGPVFSYKELKQLTEKLW